MFVLRCYLLVYFVSLIAMTGARIYDRCDFARTLRYKHKFSLSEINVWACIAQYQSGFNTEAIGYDSDGTGYHGLFQISDLYWCSKSDKRKNACSMLCSQFLDDDLTDDFKCIKSIFEEHQRLSGNGYNAWTSYKDKCQYVYDGLFTDDCFVGDVDYIPSSTSMTKVVTKKATQNRIYDRCELARELWYVHQLPADQLATWVCIAKHESNYNTSAIGYGDHGLFQISDIYWCSPPGRGWVCGISCAKLQDSDISDDVECMKKIYDEHQRLSGDGFNAWSVYKPYCKGRSEAYIEGCFDYSDSNSIVPYSYEDELHSGATASHEVKSHPDKSKIYERCELATELHQKHKIPIELVATYVCIAYYESKYNTSAVGRSNSDGSSDHGIFQISDIYWCSPPGMGRACSLSCDKLEDSDITNDVECMKKIYDEHEHLSGDGFNAWSVYDPYCKGQSDRFVDGCFDEISNSLVVLNHRPAVTAPSIFRDIPESPPTLHNSNSDIFGESVISSVEPPLNGNHINTRKTSEKIYERCELARELRRQMHDIPMDEISNWVCIAYHESKYDTSAIGRLNADGSADHGIFQISDIYWCSLSGRGKGCSISCTDLENANITDDIQCIKRIFKEHSGLSGDGFTAWSVYLPYCKGMASSFTEGCFEETENAVSSFNRRPGITSPPIAGSNTKTVAKAKVYTQCELALELRDKYHLPQNEVATWVCIAVHGANLSTSSVQTNVDGSSGHGIFQINDKHWCSVTGKGIGCDLSCSELEDSDLMNDVDCLKKIFQVSRQSHGNGFRSWPVYHSHCKFKTYEYVKGCFSDKIKITTKSTDKPSTSITSTTSIRSTTVTPALQYSSRTNFVSTVQTTTPTTTERRTIPTLSSQSSARSSTTTEATYRSKSPVETERERVQSLFDIYFNGFRTRPPTTLQYSFSTTNRPLSSSVGNTTNGSTSLQGSLRKSRSKNITEPSSSVTPATQLPFKTLERNVYSISTSTTKFPVYRKNSLNSHFSSLADTTTMSPFIRQSTPATLNSKITYQSIVSQRPSETTVQSLPAYYSNRLTTTNPPPSINQNVNTHDNSVSMFNNRFTRAPSPSASSSSTFNNNFKLTSSQHKQYDQRISTTTTKTQNPFDKIFDLFVH